MKLQDRYYELSCTNRKYCGKRPPLDNLVERDYSHDFPKYAVRHTFHQQAPVCRTPSKISDSIPRLAPGIYSSLGWHSPRREHVQLLRCF
jgi:hypothetical protein